VSAKALIQVKDLRKQFGKQEVLKGITTDIKAGEVVCVIGPSGSGKSTFLRCLNRLEEASSGSIFFEGEDLCDKKTDIDRVRQRMGMVFQQFNLFPHMNILKNLTLGPIELQKRSREEAEAYAMELLHKVGLAERANAYPQQLSGGQQQRIAIVRALCMKPDVLLFDEPTSALDPNTTESILNLIRDINRTLGITVVMITHQMSVIEAVCDRVAIIDQSRIAEEGEVQRIFSAPQSKIGRELILGGDVRQEEFGASKKIRVTFDGRSAFEPVIANMILGCQLPVNILFAATKEIGGQAAGQMVLQLPENEADAMKLIHYLRERGVNLEEVKNSDF